MLNSNVGVTMKKQIGIWVDGAVWQAYRDLCSREKLRPAEPVEKFLRFILRGGSALSVLNWLEKAGKIEGFEAYARVLLNWYREGKMWMYVTDEDEAPMEPMLLEALKQVENPALRREIEDALTVKAGKKKAKPKAELEASNAIEKKVAELKRLVKGSH
jgi:hypothetical protein